MGPVVRYSGLIKAIQENEGDVLSSSPDREFVYVILSTGLGGLVMTGNMVD